jgi:nucleoside-diphosphate-sugar epimerase
MFARNVAVAAAIVTMMKVFVAGASGVIGRHLVPLLAHAGHEVTGMTRSPRRAEGIRAQGAGAVVCDAFDAEALRAAVAAANPDAVIHELTDLPIAMEPRKFKTQLAPTNRLRREGTRNLLAAARAAGVNRVLAQSIAFAYAPEGDWVKDEDARLAVDAPPPMHAAIGAIAELEQQVLEFGGVVLRYGYFYGPGTQFAPDGFYAGLARKRQLPVLGSGEGRWSFIHVDDAAAATVAALEHASPGVYNIVDDDPARTREWVPVYAASVGAKRPWTLPAWIGRLAAGRTAVTGMTEARAASNAKAKRELGWTPQHASWRDGFRTAAG